MDFNKLLDNVSEKINSVNCGGCGVFAFELAKRLPGAKVVVFDNRYDINYLVTNGMAFQHCMVWYKGLLIDGKNTYSHREGFKYCDEYKEIGDIPIDQLKKLVKNPYIWNRSFNRGQIPTLRGIIRKFVENFDDRN